jgi:hypothetical protein
LKEAVPEMNIPAKELGFSQIEERPVVVAPQKEEEK